MFIKRQAQELRFMTQQKLHSVRSNWYSYCYTDAGADPGGGHGGQLTPPPSAEKNDVISTVDAIILEVCQYLLLIAMKDKAYSPQRL